jgi:hypothetical protein
MHRGGGLNLSPNLLRSDYYIQSIKPIKPETTESPNAKITPALPPAIKMFDFPEAFQEHHIAGNVKATPSSLPQPANHATTRPMPPTPRIIWAQLIGTD